MATFLLAQLHLESLIGRRSAKSTRAALKELSKGFDDHTYGKAYRNAISRVQGQLGEQTDLAMQTLSWLVCARRPLTSLEPQHALAIEEGEPIIDEENKPEVEDILAVCAGLVTVENESGIIRLVHYTTQEYLERKKEFLFPNAQDAISILCVTYISFEILGSGICESDEAFEESLESHPFYLYAARHWGDHISQKLLPQNKRSTLGHTQSQKVGARIFQGKRRGCISLHTVGLKKQCFTFFEITTLWKFYHNNGWTPLRYAISGSRLNVVRLLLSHGADPNGVSQDHDIPLALAAQYGKDAIVKLLLEWGADADAPDRWYGSALIAACDEDQLKTAEIPVNSKADMNPESKLYGIPLEAAASAGHTT
ncbi:hypothetical protein PENCOP_c005G07298 [Penicillium coprophilum]|uniref:GPI inositol-deacylase winged helix domain-containing protein n=1 Tax=Penicillium coprophilum TaxID=36646 RepID=A0A1V6USD7_9EURO|nr:hypothetical protein PENCOP_c005G07298 [Penicillium coprophilum]